MKPYKHPSKRIQHRDSSGKFTTPCLDAEICRHCKSFILPDSKFENGLLVKKYPSHCPTCKEPTDKELQQLSKPKP